MATTRLMPLHTGKGRTVGTAIEAIIDYVENPEKTDNRNLITSWQCDSRVADSEFLFSKQQYIKNTGRMRGADDVIAYHLRQSFRPGEITPEEANRLGCELARRFTKGNLHTHRQSPYSQSCDLELHRPRRAEQVPQLLGQHQGSAPPQ